MSYYITTDAACDLRTSQYRDLFHVIPMSYMIDDTVYGIDNNITIEEFYAKVKGGAMPTTTLVNSYFAKEHLTPILKQGFDLIHICFSSGMSATYDQMVAAFKDLREEFPDRKILLIDSLSATAGQGLLVLNALDARDNGMSIEDNYSYTSELAKHICHYFTVEDLFHLQRGGRVSKGMAIVGSALNVKPLMYCNVLGKLAPYDKVIGRKKALLALIKKITERIDHSNMKYVYVVHSAALEEAEYVAHKLHEHLPSIGELLIDYIGPIIGSHTGCGVVGIVFVGDTRVEPKDDTLR